MSEACTGKVAKFQNSEKPYFQSLLVCLHLKLHCFMLEIYRAGHFRYF